MPYLERKKFGNNFAEVLLLEYDTSPYYEVEICRLDGNYFKTLWKTDDLQEAEEEFQKAVKHLEKETKPEGQDA